MCCIYNTMHKPNYQNCKTTDQPKVQSQNFAKTLYFYIKRKVGIFSSDLTSWPGKR